MSRTLHAFITCSLEKSRANVLDKVIDNIVECSKARPALIDDIIVFDNASTQPGTIERLVSVFPRVHVSDKNVGYWTALDWILRNRAVALSGKECDLLYVIESDMIHYDIEKLATAEAFLRSRADIGAVRCMEYSVANMHLYDKSVPVQGGKRWAWQNHVHLVTGERITHTQSEVPGLYLTSFLTHLPALNRLAVVDKAIAGLRTGKSFTEHDFQRACYEEYAVNALIDDGIFHVKLTAGDDQCVSGSWSPSQQLDSIGYKATRRDKIVSQSEYSVRVIERRD